MDTASLTLTAARKTELYIPPAPPESKDALFATMAAGINFDRYDEISVEITGRDPPKNITSFSECGFFETTMKNVEHCHYTRPTPVQKYAIPIIMANRDLMACAQTGSGKTVSRPKISSSKRRDLCTKNETLTTLTVQRELAILSI